MPYRERSLRVVVAPDAFGGSMTAAQAASAMSDGVAAAADRRAVPMTVRTVPVSDGGPGLVAAVVAAGFTAHSRRVTGPLGRPVDAAYAVGLLDGRRTAVVELAQASGLGALGRRPSPRTAMSATTFGTGELVRAALGDDVEVLVLGLGGSAATDAGTGLLTALGARFLDADGHPLPPGGGALSDLAGVDVSGLDPRLRHVEIQLACDVASPLTGPHGAASVFAPQKGADPAQVEALTAGLHRFADVTRRDLGVDVSSLPGGGAAGGTAAGAVAFLGARIEAGIDVVLDVVRFDEAVIGAVVVLTGEGSLDEQTLTGKAPLGIARRAQAHGVPTLMVAGQVHLDEVGRAKLRDLGCVGTSALTDLEPDVDLAVAGAEALTRRATGELLASWLADHLQRGSPR